MQNAECWPDAGTVVAFPGILHSSFFILHSPKWPCSTGERYLSTALADDARKQVQS